MLQSVLSFEIFYVAFERLFSFQGFGIANFSAAVDPDSFLGDRLVQRIDLLLDRDRSWVSRLELDHQPGIFGREFCSLGS